MYYLHIIYLNRWLDFPDTKNVLFSKEQNIRKKVRTEIKSPKVIFLVTQCVEIYSYWLSKHGLHTVCLFLNSTCLLDLQKKKKMIKHIKMCSMIYTNTWSIHSDLNKQETFDKYFLHK